MRRESFPAGLASTLLVASGAARRLGLAVVRRCSLPAAWRAGSAAQPRHLLLLLLCALPAPAAAVGAPGPAVHGRVSRVVDGDTLWINLPDQAALVVRLHNIDAPERCQPWGNEATRALVDLALDKPAAVRSHGRDSHGRVVGTVLVDGVDIGERLVQEGHAWSTRSRWDRGPLVKQERMARALGRGLHALADNELPWEFRKRHGPCAGGADAGTSGSQVGDRRRPGLVHPLPPQAAGSVVRGRPGAGGQTGASPGVLR